MAFWWPCNRPFLGFFFLLFLSWTEVMENPSTPLERAIVNLLILKLFVWSSQETGPQNLRNFIVLCLVGSTNLHIDIVTMATSLINHFCYVCEEEVEKHYFKPVIVGSLIPCLQADFLFDNQHFHFPVWSRIGR